MAKILPQVPLDFSELPPDKMLHASSDFQRRMATRRTVRDFSSRPVDAEIINNCVKTAASAPSGANQQPWHFVVVKDEERKREIRLAAEEEERAFYDGRASDQWLDAVIPLGTNESKPFLETAPYIIAVFAERYLLNENGAAVKNFYVNESVGIATGMLLAALHLSGLATLTHTPAPMKFLNRILQRPDNERPYLMVVVGYPAETATVPAIQRKSLEDICTWL